MILTYYAVGLSMCDQCVINVMWQICRVCSKLERGCLHCPIPWPHGRSKYRSYRETKRWQGLTPGIAWSPQLLSADFGSLPATNNQSRVSHQCKHFGQGRHARWRQEESKPLTRAPTALKASEGQMSLKWGTKDGQGTTIDYIEAQPGQQFQLTDPFPVSPHTRRICSGQ